jgi:hypothetical protein
LAISRASGFRRDTYLRVLNGSTFYGYSDDEYLSRRIFLAARRIGWAEVAFHYRLAPRRGSGQEKALGTLTHVKLTALAGGVAQGGNEALFRASRNQLVRSIAGLAVATKDPSALDVFRQAVSEARILPIAWPISNLLHRAAFAAARLVLALRQ